MNDDHTFAPEMTAEEAIQMVLKRPEMYGLQRVTAVPDVATEREIAIIEEHREKWMARAFRAEAERDAALATLERVRAIAERHGMKPWTEEIFAALDRLTVRKAAPAEAFCIEHGNFHAVELGDPTCEFEDGFGELVDGEKP